MNIRLKISFIGDNGMPFMGPGPLRLLERIRECKSIQQAAKSMNLSYVKALKILNHLEKALDQKMLFRKRGGNDRGGAQLTKYAEFYMESYKRLEKRVNDYAQEEFHHLLDELKEENHK